MYDVLFLSLYRSARDFGMARDLMDEMYYTAMEAEKSICIMHKCMHVAVICNRLSGISMYIPHG